MDSDRDRMLSKAITAKELSKISPDIAIKIEKFFEQRFEGLLRTNALYEEGKKEIGMHFSIFQ